MTGTETDYLGINTKYNFYLGGTDSCQGKLLNIGNFPLKDLFIAKSGE